VLSFGQIGKFNQLDGKKATWFSDEHGKLALSRPDAAVPAGIYK
jgi:hypothetical protein